MESLPTLQNLHDALVSDSAVDAEEELLSVMTHLLVCAIEDPGIPNPGRHTTLLGQSLRNADITNANVSEVLRIYLYAVATGEVRQMSGVTLDRDKEKRVADHHQIDMECLNSSGKNQQYYELLHENETWKLSLCLKDKPFVALNPTKKAQILAHLCNDLLMNKAVLKQIEGSLESCAQIKREKYLNDMKVRKYKSLHMRKVRMEAYEKAQQMEREAAAQQLEMIKKEALATEEATAAAIAAATAATAAVSATLTSTMTTPSATTTTPLENNNNNSQEQGEKMEVDEVPNYKEEHEDITTAKIMTVTGGTSLNNNEKMEDSPIKTSIINATTIAPTTSTPIAVTTTTTIPTDTTPIKNTTKPSGTEECGVGAYQNGSSVPNDINHLMSKKIKSRDDASTDVGLDDDLSDVESEITTVEEDEDNRMTAEEVHKKLEALINSSAQSKQLLEQASNSLRATCYGQDRYWRRYWKLPKAGGIFVEAIESAQNEIFEYHKILEEEIKNKIEDLTGDDDNEEMRPPEPPEEIPTAAAAQATPMPSNITTADSNFKDLDDEIPHSVVQLPGNNQNEDQQQKQNAIVTTNKDTIMTIAEKNDSGIEENDKMEDEVCDNSVKMEISKTDESVITNTPEIPKCQPSSSAMDKWFSIVNREMPLSSAENISAPEFQLAYSNITCDSIVQIQGNRWDIANNAQYFTVPIESGKVDLQFRNESILSLSGLDEQMVESIVTGEEYEPKDEDDARDEMVDIKVGRSEVRLDEATGIPLQTLANMSLGNINAYITCDIPTPLSMTPEEHRLMEKVKEIGFPKRLEKNYVPAELRHGWWRIDTLELLNEVIQSLHQRGVRERELRQNLLRAINESLDFSNPCPLVGDGATLTDPKTHTYVPPDNPKDWNPKIAKRVELQLLEQLEALEDKIASASMQVKNWVLPPRIENEISIEQEDITEEDFVSIIPMIRERIASLEAAIERRYLKPPLGVVTADASLAIIAQNQLNQQSGGHAQQQNQNQQQQSNNDSSQQGGTATSSAAGSPASACSSEKDSPIQENMPKGLVSWREAVSRSHTTSQLAMALYVLESCVAWDKSIMKAVSK